MIFLSILYEYLDLRQYFWIILNLRKKCLFSAYWADNFWTTIGIMLPPLLSSQIGYFEIVHSWFGWNFEFLAIFLDYFKFEFWILGNIFGLFWIWAENTYFQRISADNFWTSSYYWDHAISPNIIIRDCIYSLYEILNFWAYFGIIRFLTKNGHFQDFFIQ